MNDSPLRDDVLLAMSFDGALNLEEEAALTERLVTDDAQANRLIEMAIDEAWITALAEVASKDGGKTFRVRRMVVADEISWTE